MSLEKSTVCVQARAMRPTFKKVQVVYYLSRNGQLEHPHTVEVTHLAHQQLRLKDVLDRLTVLRGKGMPTLYSWSCKRSYKNGYVWNDLGENDIIYPSERAEYVLKASELIDDASDKSFNSLHNGNALVTKNHHKDTYLVSEPRIITSQALKNKHCHHNNGVKEHGDQRDDEEEEEYGTKSCSITPHRCSKGVSTDELQEEKTLLPSDMSNASTTSFSISTPSTTSSTVSDKTHDSTTQNKIRDNCNNNNTGTDSSNTCKKHENGDAAEFNEPMLSRNSMLLSLIACGAGSVSFRKSANNNAVASSTEGRKSGNFLHSKEVVSIDPASTGNKVVIKSVDDDAITIGSMSENPRFGNLQAEEKEYFSGSIVESVVNYNKSSHHDNADPRLKKSSSCNEERSEVSGIREAAEQEEEITKKEKVAKGKCIPRTLLSSKILKK